MIEVKAIAPRKRDLLPFVKFPIRLYRGNPCYVPPLVLDEVATLSPDKNPAFDFCEAQCFIAYRDGKPAGRIAAIINRQVNERTGHLDARFGFFDFVDDRAVSAALLGAAKQWAAKRA